MEACIKTIWFGSARILLACKLTACCKGARTTVYCAHWTVMRLGTSKPAKRLLGAYEYPGGGWM